MHKFHTILDIKAFQFPVLLFVEIMFEYSFYYLSVCFDIESIFEVYRKYIQTPELVSGNRD